MTTLNLLSEKLLFAVKTNVPTYLFVGELSDLNIDALEVLENDHQKMAFWINIYNAFYQILAKNNPNIDKKVYGLKEIDIAQQTFSLDDIEHGILRCGHHKYSLGFLKNQRRYRLFKKLQPSLLDYRIHFALNCGAKSCPPIAFYSAENLEQELDLATQGFLESETSFYHSEKTMIVSRLLLWFYNDFGRKQGIYKMVAKYLDQSVEGYKVQYHSYDWTPTLGEFK